MVSDSWYVSDDDAVAVPRERVSERLFDTVALPDCDAVRLA